MDCVNHSGRTASVYCQNCGKGHCAECVTAGALRQIPGGQVLCASCLQGWQNYQAPFAAPVVHTPSPSAAAVLGFIPGVGAMYNGQFFKGLVHVAIFVVLVSITDHYPIFGLFIAAWVLYQSFEAYHTALARREGRPVPDPLGLNEVGHWLNMGSRQSPPQDAQPTAGAWGIPQQPAQQTQPPAGQAGYAPQPGAYTPPPDPVCWKRREPFGAVVLIALGMLFLLNQLDLFHGRVFEFGWPFLLIGLGVWMMIRRSGEGQGGPQ